MIFYNEKGDEVCLHNVNSFNKGKTHIYPLLVKSIKQLGCGKSVLVDKDNTIISGAKVLNAASDAGIKKIRIIETKGDELIVIKRSDICAESKRGYELSLVDNLIASKNLEWNVDEVFSAIDKTTTFDPTEWNGYECIVKELELEQLIKDGLAMQKTPVKKEKVITQENLQFSLFD